MFYKFEIENESEAKPQRYWSTYLDKVCNPAKIYQNVDELLQDNKNDTVNIYSDNVE